MGRRETGVTLVELLTVVTMVAVLASIAVPSYRKYVLRANRADAKTALLQLQAAQEKFYLQNNAYATGVTSVTDLPPTGLGMNDVTQNGYYKISVAPSAGDVNNQSFTATATPIAGKGQTADKQCLSFTLTDTGKRDVSVTGNGPICWK